MPIYMLHADLGCRPIEINIKSRMIGFWLSEKRVNCLRYYTKRCYMIIMQEFMNINGYVVSETSLFRSVT